MVTGIADSLIITITCNNNNFVYNYTKNRDVDLYRYTKKGFIKQRPIIS